MRPASEVSEFNKIETAISGILTLFKRYETHATWAVVGLLAHDSLAELHKNNRHLAVAYKNQNLSPFPLESSKYDNLTADELTGMTAIKAILSTDYQELSSHTYSHFYAIEEGIGIPDFERDCAAMQAIGDQLNNRFKTIIFPRNQVNPTFLPICSKYGYVAYRGNQENRFWTNSAFDKESIFKKAGRLVDAYIKISKTGTYRMETLKREETLINIPSNRFFRPYSGKNWLEKRKIKRIKREMLKAAKKGTIYHLWWHPHNFAQHLDKSLAQLEELLAYSIVLQKHYNFTSLNMNEIAARANA